MDPDPQGKRCNLGSLQLNRMRRLLFCLLISMAWQTGFAQTKLELMPEKLRPKRHVSLPDDLVEISGMIFYNGFLYAHNDGGHPSHVYRVDPQTGEINQTIVLQGIPNIDWEELAQDTAYFYLCDVGGNNQLRPQYDIYKIPKSLLQAAADTLLIPGDAIEKISYSYPDQRPESLGVEFDCEAVVVHNNALHLFSKNWVNQYAYHYRVPVEAGHYVAEKLDSMDTKGYLLTAAIQVNNVLLFTSYNIKGKAALIVVEAPGADLKITRAKRIRLPWALRSGQIEAIENKDGYTWISNEAFGVWFIKVKQKLRRLEDRKWYRISGLPPTAH